MKINDMYIVEKRNIINEIRKTEMGFQELRFFSIYLSKINSRDPNTRIVRFLLEDFRNLMGLGRLNIQYFKKTTDKLLGKVINIDNPDGGYTAFQIFKKCKIYQEEQNFQWYIIIDAHDDALPLLFNFKRDYFTYPIWNVLNLKSSNQLRMYEILKQYEYAGKRELGLEQLKELLGIGKEKYSRWDVFVTKVIKTCQKALLEGTDICFTYEPVKGGRGKKITGVKFIITKNENPVKKISLEDLAKSVELHEVNSDNIPLPEAISEPIYVEEITEEITNANKNEPIHLELQVEAQAPKSYSNPKDKQPYYCSNDEIKDSFFVVCKREFAEPEMDLLIEIAAQIPTINPEEDRKQSVQSMRDFLANKYKELCYRDGKNPIKYRFAYLKKLLEVGKIKMEAEIKQLKLEEQLEYIGSGCRSQRRNNWDLETKPSYDIAAYEKYSVLDDDNRNEEKLDEKLQLDKEFLEEESEFDKEFKEKVEEQERRMAIAWSK